MIFDEIDKRNGRRHVVCSKVWPDGTRFRRRCPNRTIAKAVHDRIVGAIAMGTWRELKNELTKGPDPDYSVKDFSEVYLKEYCEIRNSRPDFKRETFQAINEIVGDVKIKRFTASDALQFETQRSQQVSAATVNGGLAVLSNMLTFAVRKGLIARNPMEGYGRIKLDERALRVMEPAEARLIVEKTIEVDPVVGAYVGVLCETGLRMEEGLLLKWDFVDVPRRRITVEASKSRKVRHVPMSEYCARLISGLTRIVGEPHVFVRESTMERLRAPRKEFNAGKQAAGILWPGFHDFRHYRATQWLRNGIDIRTVKEWLGHKDIKTTMIYLHFVEDRADKRFEEAQRLEQLQIAESAAKVATDGQQGKLLESKNAK